MIPKFSKLKPFGITALYFAYYVSPMMYPDRFLLMVMQANTNGGYYLCLNSNVLEILSVSWRRSELPDASLSSSFTASVPWTSFCIYL